MFQTGPQVANDAVQGILSRIDQLAAKLGVSAQKVWKVYVLQARVEAVRDLVMAVLLLGGSFLLFKLIPIFWKKFEDSACRDYDKNGSWAAVAILSGISIFPLVIVALVNVYGAIGEALNPQYWAFQHLTLDLKNLF